MDALYKVHFKGAFFLRQKLLPLMNGGGRIVNIASGLTRITIPEMCLLCILSRTLVPTLALYHHLHGFSFRPGDFGETGRPEPLVPHACSKHLPAPVLNPEWL